MKTPCRIITILFLLSIAGFAKAQTNSNDSSNADSSSSVTASTSATADPLDMSLKVSPQDKIGSAFQDIVVVQRRAKAKAGKYLFSTGLSLDFSDGPLAMYAVNLNPGYAISDYWEIYLNIVPTFITNERSIVSKVKSLPLVAGQANLSYVKPTGQYGVDVLWLPAYGKDSWGPYSIVRSDTFVKMGLGMVTYGSQSGQRYTIQLGKTYFLHNYFNIRIAGGFSYVETVVDGVKSFNLVGLFDGGLVFYW